MRKVWLVLGIFVGMSAIALADSDPGITVSGFGDSIECGGISTNLNCVQPDGADEDTYFLYNDTGSTVTSVTFATTIATGLNTAGVQDDFTCSTNYNYYFDFCDVTYTASNGNLKYLFGLNSWDCYGPDGIPPGESFYVELDGWVSGVNVNGVPAFPNGLPTFSNSFTLATPEPSALAALGLGSFLLLGFVEFRRRRQSIS
jgi:hypothetical protein